MSATTYKGIKDPISGLTKFTDIVVERGYPVGGLAMDLSFFPDGMMPLKLQTDKPTGTIEVGHCLLYKEGKILKATLWVNGKSFPKRSKLYPHLMGDPKQRKGHVITSAFVTSVLLSVQKNADPEVKNIVL